MSVEPTAAATGGALAVAHLGYARALAREIHRTLPRHVQFDEILGWAQLGLVQAANAWRPEFGVQFETFAYRRIRGAVFDGIGKMTWLPPALRRASARQRALDELPAPQPDPGADTATLAQALRAAIRMRGVVSLLGDLDPQADDPDAAPLDLTATELPPDAAAEHAELLARLRRELAQLPAAQRTLLEAVWLAGRSMTELAADLGVNKATISRRCAAALATLAERLGPA